MVKPKPQLSTLLFLLKGDQILLAMKKCGFGAGKWNGVGGKVEPEESLEAAMFRECQEEIGVTPLQYHKIAIHHFANDRVDPPWALDAHVYFCSEWQGEPVETEEMAPQWFSLSEIPYTDMWEDDELWLPLSLRGKLLECWFGFDASDSMLTARLNVVDSLS